MSRRADRGQRPQWRFRERRAASCRLESVASIAFRKALGEGNRREIIAELLGMESLDLDRLAELSTFREYAPVLGVICAVVEPRITYADHSDFDREMCLTGLKRFVRPIMPSDRRNDLALDRSTGVFSTSGDAPEVLAFTSILVREVQPGFRIRRGLVRDDGPGSFLWFEPGTGTPTVPPDRT
jgi:hypothetical protein